MSAAVPGLYFTRAAPAAEASPLRSDIAGFIGRTRRGPVNTPTRVQGWREYNTVFGGLAPDALTTYAICGYFDNGGEIAHVIRLAPQGPLAPRCAKATWQVMRPSIGARVLSTLPGAFRHDEYEIVAESPGAWANGTRITIRYRARGASQRPELDFVVQVPGEPTAYELGVPVATLAAPEPQGRMLSAGLVRIAVREESAGPLALDGPQVLSWTITLDGGSDGATPSAADYRAAAGVLAEEQEVALVCVPDLCAHVAAEDDRLEVVAAMVAQAEAARDRLVLVDLPDTAQSAAEALAWLEALPHADIPGGFRAAVAYHPRLWVRDPFGGNAEPLKAVPPSGHIAGVISRLDRERGAHHTPANAVIYEAIDVERRFKREEQARLNDGGINLLRCFPGRGLQVWGGRTLAREASSRFVAHRRLVHRLVRAIRRVAAPRVFDTNGPELWLAIVRAVTTVLLAAYRNGALKGARADEAFRVRCNEKTTLPEEREQGLVVCEIEIAPAVPMEFILLRIALAGDANLDVFEP